MLCVHLAVRGIHHDVDHDLVQCCTNHFPWLVYNRSNSGGFCCMLSTQIGPFIDASLCGRAEDLAVAYLENDGGC